MARNAHRIYFCSGCLIKPWNTRGRGWWGSLESPGPGLPRSQQTAMVHTDSNHGGWKTDVFSLLDSLKPSLVPVWEGSKLWISSSCPVAGGGIRTVELDAALHSACGLAARHGSWRMEGRKGEKRKRRAGVFHWLPGLHWSFEVGWAVSVHICKLNAYALRIVNSSGHQCLISDLDLAVCFTLTYTAPSCSLSMPIINPHILFSHFSWD